MHVVDTVHKTELDTDYNGLIDFMVKGRQVDLYLPKEKTDSDGYLTWDVEHWTSVDGRRVYPLLFPEGPCPAGFHQPQPPMI